MARIACLHTAQSNVAVFETARRALGLAPLHHEVRADLLAEAEAAGGMTEATALRTAAYLQALSASAEVVLLTCSSIGSAVDLLGPGDHVIRVDAALARAACATGGHVVVLCAAAATIAPTRAVFEHAAAATGATVELRLVADAWADFRAGDTQAYLARIAAAASLALHEGAVVALAQASMADVLQLLPKDAAVLASPQAGLAAAVSLMTSQTIGSCA